MNYDDVCASFLTADDDFKSNKKSNDDDSKKVKAINYKKGTPNADCKLCMMILEKLNDYQACCADCHLASIGANSAIYDKASGGITAKGDGKRMVPSHYDKRGMIKEHGPPWKHHNTRSNGKSTSTINSTSNNHSHTNNKRKYPTNNKNYKKNNYSKSNVQAIYILDNDEYEGEQVVDNHVNNYVEASDDEDDNDNPSDLIQEQIVTIITVL